MDEYETLSKNELVDKILEAESNMKQAAMYGNQLLTENMDLKNELTKLTLLSSENEQTIHELRGQIDLEIGKQKNIIDDSESYRTENIKIREENSDLKEEIRRLEQLNISQSHEILLKDEKFQTEYRNIRNCYEKQIESLREELNAALEKSGNRDQDLNHSESFCNTNLLNDLADLRKEKEDLMQSYKEALKREEQLKIFHAEGKAEVEELRGDLATQINRANHIQKQLEKAQSERAVVEDELENLKISNEAGGTRGNSLFSELEDRRIKAEQAFVKHQEKYKELERKYNIKVDELRAFKGEFMTRLSSMQKSGPSVSDMCLQERTARILELEAEVSRLRAQIDLSERQREGDLKQHLELMNAFEVPTRDPGNPTGSKHLQDTLRTQSKEIDELNKQMKFLRVQKDEAFERAIKMERELQSSSSYGVKLKFENEELRQEMKLLSFKYEELQPESGVSKPVQVAGNRRSSNLKLLTPKFTDTSIKGLSNASQTSVANESLRKCLSKTEANKSINFDKSILRTVNLDSPKPARKGSDPILPVKEILSPSKNEVNDENCKSM